MNVAIQSVNQALNRQEKQRFERQMIVQGLGLSGQKRLKSLKVAVIGVGGLGCPSVTYLASSGVGFIRLIDYDHVELSNLHRQPLYTAEDIGQLKVRCAAKRLSAINPDMTIDIKSKMLTQSNAQKLLKDVDVVLDCSDNFECRYAANFCALKLKKVLISAGVIEKRGLLFVMDAREGHESPCYNCLFPEASYKESTLCNCNTLGILPPIAGLLGNYQALLTLQYFGTQQQSGNKCITFDGDSLHWQEIGLPQTANCSLHH